MEQNQNNSLWPKIQELISKFKILTVKKIENWTKLLDNKIQEENSSDNGQIHGIKSNEANKESEKQNEQIDNIKNEKEGSSPTKVNNIYIRKGSSGIGGFITLVVIVIAFFTVPNQSDHFETLTKTTHEILLSNEDYKGLALLDDSKIQAVLKGALRENYEVKNYYLFSVCYSDDDYDDDYSIQDILDGDFVSFGIFGKVFVREEKLKNSLKENSSRNRNRNYNDNGRYNTATGRYE